MSGWHNAWVAKCLVVKLSGCQNVGCQNVPVSKGQVPKCRRITSTSTPTPSSIHFNHKKLFPCRLRGVDCFQLKVSALSSLPAKLAGTEVAFEWFLACKKRRISSRRESERNCGEIIGLSGKVISALY